MPGKSSRTQAIVITGPVGAGKSTVMDAMSEHLAGRNIPIACIDMDYLRWVRPEPPGDPFAAQLGYRNLAAIWPNLQLVDPQFVVIADVVETREQKQDYAAAMPGTIVTVVRLHAPMSLILERLAAREGERTIDWYRQRAPELQGIMERENVADIVIDVGHRAPDEVAREILDRLGDATASS